MSDHAQIDESRLLRPYEISREALRALIKAAEAGSAKIVRWEIYGRPAIDGLVAEIEVPLARAGAFVQQVAAVAELRPCLRGCVYGIPVIDGLHFRVAAGQAN